MNNRQLYKTTFSKLHTDCEFEWEAKSMETKKKLRCSRKLIIVSMILVLMLAMTCMVNAASGGQLANNVKIFINGQEASPSEYSTEDGGISINADDAQNVRITNGESETQVETNDSSDYSVKIKGDENAENLELEIKDKSNN